MSSDSDKVVISNDVVPVASPNDAVPSQDYMETDDFDTFDSPILMSSGGGVDNTIDFTGAHGYLSYYDSGNQLRNQGFNFNGSYFSVPAMSDYKRSDRVNLIFHRKNMPPAGKYKMSFYFGSNTGGFTYSKVSVYFGHAKNNASQQTDSKNVTVSQGSGDVSFSTTITVPSSFDDFQVIMYTSGIIPPIWR